LLTTASVYSAIFDFTARSAIKTSLSFEDWSNIGLNSIIFYCNFETSTLVSFNVCNPIVYFLIFSGRIFY